MVYSYTWDESAISDETYGYDLDTKINNNLKAVRERIAEEHLDPSGGSGLNYGMHTWNVTAKSTGSPYTALVTDHLLLITTGASNYEIDLPSAATYPGKPYKIKKVDSGVGCVIIDPNGSETIDGSTSWTLGGQNDSVEIVSDGTNWVVLVGSTSGGTVGDIAICGTRTAPAGWLLCDGSAVSRTTYANLFNALCPEIGDPTITIANPGVVSLTSHGLKIGDKVYLITDGALPSGLSANTIYYIVGKGFTANQFSLSSTKLGAPIETTGTQSGTHTLYFCPWGLGDGSTTFNVPDFRDRFLIGKSSDDFTLIGNPTISIASPAVITMASHGLSIGDKIYLDTTGALPTGLSVRTAYYVITAGFTTGQFEVSTSREGTAINTSGSQSGTHSLIRYPIGGNLGETGGEEAHILITVETPAHTHSTPAHSHGFSTYFGELGGSSGAMYGTAFPSSTTVYTNSDGSGTSGSTGSGLAHDNIPPYVATNYRIKF